MRQEKETIKVGILLSGVMKMNKQAKIALASAWPTIPSVGATVHLGELKPDEVDVEVYHGPADSRNRITSSNVEKMTLSEDRGEGSYFYRQTMSCRSAGRYAFAMRVTPTGAEWKNTMPVLPWASSVKTRNRTSAWPGSR